MGSLGEIGGSGEMDGPSEMESLDDMVHQVQAQVCQPGHCTGRVHLLDHS